MPRGIRMPTSGANPYYEHQWAERPPGGYRADQNQEFLTGSSIGTQQQQQPSTGYVQDSRIQPQQPPTGYARNQQQSLVFITNPQDHQQPPGYVHAGRDERQRQQIYQQQQQNDYADPSVLSTQFGQILNATSGAGEDDSFRAGETSSQRLLGDVAASFNTFSQATGEVRPNAPLPVDDTKHDEDAEVDGEGGTGKKRKRWWAGFSPPPDANLFPPRSLRPFATSEVADSETTPVPMRMPPVIGSYMMFPNKRLRYNPMPPNIDEIREKFFYMREPLLLKNSQEIADIVPHLSNFWRRGHEPQTMDKRDNGVQVETWECLSRQAMRPKLPSKEGVRRRKKRSEHFDGTELCEMRLQVISYTKHNLDSPGDHKRWNSQCKCIPEWAYFILHPRIRVAETNEHSHDIELMEKYKQTHALLFLGKLKMEEGFGYSAVARWIRQTYGERSKQCLDLDGTQLNNIARQWRDQNTCDMNPLVEETDEMTAIRRCTDKIMETDDTEILRAALREAVKVSHEATKATTAFLAGKNPEVTTGDAEKDPWDLTEGILCDIPEPGLPWRLTTTQTIKVRKAQLLGLPPPPLRGMREPTEAERNRPPPSPSAAEETDGQPARTAGPVQPIPRAGPVPPSPSVQTGQISSAPTGYQQLPPPPNGTNDVHPAAHPAPPYQPPQPTSAQYPQQYPYQAPPPHNQHMPPHPPPPNPSQYAPPPWANGPRPPPSPPPTQQASSYQHRPTSVAIPAPPYASPYEAIPPPPPPPHQLTPPRASLVNYESPVDPRGAQQAAGARSDRSSSGRPPYRFADDRRRSSGGATVLSNAPFARPSWTRPIATPVAVPVKPEKS